MRHTLYAACLFAGSMTCVHAEIQTRTLSYEVDGTPIESVLVYDDAGPAQRPALVMVPNWMGVNASQVEKAKAIAGKDYVILVADVYGTATRPADADERQNKLFDGIHHVSPRKPCPPRPRRHAARLI